MIGIVAKVYNAIASFGANAKRLRSVCVALNSFTRANAAKKQKIQISIDCTSNPLILKITSLTAPAKPV